MSKLNLFSNKFGIFKIKKFLRAQLTADEVYPTTTERFLESIQSSELRGSFK